MHKRPKILVGMVGGGLWAFAIVWGAQLVKGPFLPANIALLTAFFVPGLSMLAMIGRLAQRRFFDDETIDGEAFSPGSAAWVDQRVLVNTTEQIVLALAIWPFVAVTLGGMVVLVMGFAFGLARVLFWAGYHLSPPLRGFGFAATFYPTVLAAFWSIFVWAS
ncbi:MAG: MAPEG family protein [Paracoccaceae bacterium]